MLDRPSVVTGTSAVTGVVSFFFESMYFIAFKTHGFLGLEHTVLPCTVVNLKQDTKKQF